jgi:hypothetical protein
MAPNSKTYGTVNLYVVEENGEPQGANGNIEEQLGCNSSGPAPTKKFDNYILSGVSLATGFFNSILVGENFIMNYFQAYLPSLDQAIVAAWDSQIAEAAETSWLAQALTTKSADLFPRFAARYAELRALPRGARRALQRQLARSHVPANVPAEWQRKLASSLAGAALLLALAQGAQAATINVAANKTNINAADGQCSLIEAIVNANDDAATHADCIAGSGADDIVLAPYSIHTLTKINNSDYGATGLPVITTPITITGSGGTIRRKLIAPRFRIFAVNATGDLTLDDVTVSRGRKSSINGGGVYSYYGTVTITNSTISGNRGLYGGGVHNSGGVLTIDGGSTITGNRAGGGGGVNSYNGTLTITNSTISNNTATRVIGGYGSGGGVFSHADLDSFPTSIVDSTVTGNRSRYGGGVFAENTGNLSSLTIDNSTISQNTAVRTGGGIYNFDGSLTIINSSVVTDNSAKFGGGIYNSAGDLSIDSSTVSDNRATGLSFSSGGGIYNNATATLVVTTSSTITGNRSRYGGGVFNGGYFNIDYSTVSNNTATGRTFSSGGGISNYVTATLMVINSTTISGNISRRGGGVFNAGYFYTESSTITTNTATVIGGGVYNFDDPPPPPTSSSTFVPTNSSVTGNTPDDVYP